MKEEVIDLLCGWLRMQRHYLLSCLQVIKQQLDWDEILH